MTTTQPNTVAQRIERVPLSRFHRRFITLVSLGGWFDFYDIYMMAYIGATLQHSGFLSLHQFSEVIAAGFLGMFCGTIFFGMGSDLMGRRSAFVAMLLIYSAFTLAGAFAPSPTWLIVLRFFAGIGIGAELVVIDTYISEMVPSGARGRYVAISQMSGFTAVPIVAILVRLLAPTHFLIDGWRWVMVIGAAGAVLAWYFRRALPESPRWLESRGFHQQAGRVVAALEALAKTEGASRPPVSPPVPAAPSVFQPEMNNTGVTKGEAERASFAELWRPPYLRRTVMLMIFHMLQTIGYYGFANWAPTFLLRRGVSLLQSLDYTFLIAMVSPLGPALAVFTSEPRTQVGHRPPGAIDRRSGAGVCVLVASGDDRAQRRADHPVQQLVFGAAACLPVGIVSHAHARHRGRVHLQLEPPKRGVFLLVDRRRAPSRRCRSRVRPAGGRHVRRRRDHRLSGSAHQPHRPRVALPLGHRRWVPQVRFLKLG